MRQGTDLDRKSIKKGKGEEIKIELEDSDDDVTDSLRRSLELWRVPLNLSELTTCLRRQRFGKGYIKTPHCTGRLRLDDLQQKEWFSIPLGTGQRSSRPAQALLEAESKARREKEESEKKARIKTEKAQESDSMTQPQSRR